jgi:site-specific DNA-methyltransferase (adenine-specific)
MNPAIDYKNRAPFLHVGDCREVLQGFDPDSVDAIVTDPPYELGFMGKKWDNTGIAFDRATWAAALRVLKPGGHMLAFGGTRTYHRIACAIEDAGFEIRDCLSWLYGTGFPKSLNVGEGRGTALKPAWEPVILARKPLAGTVAANVEDYGTGALNIDGCRIATTDDLNGGRYSDNKQGDDGAAYGSGINLRSANDYAQPTGRWPANVTLDEHAAALLDEQSAPNMHSAGKARDAIRQADGAGMFGLAGGDGHRLGDSGGASRFFYVAKASGKERDAGCDALPARSGGEATDREDDSAGVANPRAGAGRGGGRRNFHPTVKPVALMRWLVRLVTPPGGIVLDPFAGSGSTGVAALAEGFRFLGIEQSAEYAEIARARLTHAEAR